MDTNLHGEAKRRWQALQVTVEQYGRSWHEDYETENIDENWYPTYQADQ